MAVSCVCGLGDRLGGPLRFAALRQWIRQQRWLGHTCKLSSPSCRYGCCDSSQTCALTQLLHAGTATVIFRSFWTCVLSQVLCSGMAAVTALRHASLVNHVSALRTAMAVCVTSDMCPQSTPSYRYVHGPCFTSLTCVLGQLLYSSVTALLACLSVSVSQGVNTVSRIDSGFRGHSGCNYSFLWQSAVPARIAAGSWT